MGVDAIRSMSFAVIATATVPTAWEGANTGIGPAQATR